MNRHVNAIANRLSLRQPQRDSLEILARVCEIIELDKAADAARQLEIIKGEFPSVEDFEREFPSLCFALATGVGKTRLMGAFIAYLAQAEGVRHYFVLAPNLTIYNKLIADFTPNTPKYVFQGIAEFATKPPVIITGDNYESGRGVRSGQTELWDEAIHVNVFNISKINSEVRGGQAPRIKRLSEYIGESYFDYLAGLDDLVLLMDESHRYRASAGVKAINELKPILGLELTATPQVERGQKTESFKNAIYSYPLANALADGFVKQPSVATRENFDAGNYDESSLERLKLEDGVRIHEECKVQLEVYARENGVKRVKPFMLVVARDTDHASALVKAIEAEDFFEGQYQGKVLEVHSKAKGEEKDEVVEQLLTVEDPANPVEIVVHVNMLKEGWDVTNLYTIVPLRRADSRTLVEQSIGRGLRLPFGKRTGNDAVDRLTIVAHDKFQDIIDEANRGDSILVTGVVIGKDIPDKKSEVVEAMPKVKEVIEGQFETEPKKEVAKATFEIIGGLEGLPSSSELTSEPVKSEIIRKVKAAITPAQQELAGMEDALSEESLEEVVSTVAETYVNLTIDVPQIVLVPTGEVTCGFSEFELDASSVRFQPVADDILIQTLKENQQTRISSLGTAEEQKLEDYLVQGLAEFDDVNYDEHAEFLYRLAGEMVAHLNSYLPDDAAVLNVIRMYNRQLVQLIHAQMEENQEEQSAGHEIHVVKGFTQLSSNAFQVPKGENARNFRQPVDDKKNIHSMIFGGFEKCLYMLQKFDSDSERRFAVVVENDDSVEKWNKPSRGNFRIRYGAESEYEPDFVVETATTRYLCEPKAENEMSDEVVQAKAAAAVEWCEHATKVGGKPWKYLLIPHSAIDEAQTIEGLANKFGC